MKKIKSITIKDLLGCLFLLGAISIVATSPYFLYNVMKLLFKSGNYGSNDKNKFRSAFYYAKRNGLIEIENNGHDIKISITEKGRVKMKKYKIEDLKIKIPKRWDEKFRVVIFDIPNTQKVKRNAFRGKLKELGFYSTQKSVWLHPYDCQKEIKILMDFLGLTNRQIQIFVADKVEDDTLLRKIKDVYDL
jgi:DNA-binding transcriptional regulator PaaX